MALSYQEALDFLHGNSNKKLGYANPNNTNQVRQPNAVKRPIPYKGSTPMQPLTYEQSRLPTAKDMPPLFEDMQLKEKPFQPKPQENGFGLFLKSVKNPIETIGSISNSVINLGEKNYQERTQKHEQALSDYKIMQQQLKSKDTATQSYEWKKKYFDTLFEMNKANAPIKPINSPILDKINDAFTSASPSVSQQMAAQREHAYQGLTRNMSPTAKMATDIGIGGAQLASDTAVSLMTGVPIIAQYGVSGGAQAAQEALDKGLSSDKALMYGVGSGALTALIESAGGVGGDLLTKPIKTKIGTSVLGNILLDAISEGGEGAAENVLQTLLKNGMLNESEKISLKDLLHTFVLEGAVGGLFGGAKALPAIAEPVTGRMAVNSIVKNQGIQDMRTQGINPITSGTKLDNSYVLQKQDFSKVNVPQSNVILPKPLDVSGKIDVQGVPIIKSQYDMPKVQIPRKLKPLGLPPSRMYARPNGVIMDRLPLKNQSADNVINRVEKFGSDILEDDYENNIFSALSDEEVKDANEIIELSQGANMSPTDFIDAFSESDEKAINEEIDGLAKYLATYKGKGTSIIPIKQDYGADNTGYRVSNNDEWYRDFYAQFGRAPRKSEFRDIADSLIHKDIKRGGGQYLSPEMAQDYNYMQKLKATVSKIGENAVNLTNDYGGTVVERGRFRREIQPKYSPVNARQIITPNGRVLGKGAEQPLDFMKLSKDNANLQSTAKNHSIGAKAAEFEQEQKVSKMRSNTIQKSEMFTQAEKELLNPNEFQYDVMSEKQSLKQAAQRLQADFEGEVADLPNKRNFDGTDTDTSMGIAESYLKDARQSGNYAKVLEWTKKTQQNITSSGQAIQALAKYSRTPEGKILEAQAVINEAENAVKAPFDKEKGKYPKTAKPALWGAINEETEQITMAIDTANKKAVDEAVKLLPEERLAKKIEATTANTIRKNSAINDLVNELFRSAKESPLPQTLKTKRNPIDLLSQAIENKSEYTEVWNNAKEILLKKYSDNAEISAMLDDYFNKGIVPTYSQATLENSLKTAAGELSVDLRKIIKASYGEKEKSLADITNYLIEKTGATGTDAKLLSQNIYDKYYEVLKLNSQKELSRIFENKKEIPYKGQKTVKQQVLELINLGGYSDSAVMDIIKQKHDLPVLTGEDISNILEYMQKSQDFLQGSRMQQILIAKADKIIAEKQPVTLNEKFRGAQRVSMLSNPKTLITRNPFGNIILGAVENAKDIPGAVIDMITSKITGQRTTAFPSFEVGKAQLKGAVTGLKEWSEDIKYKVDTSPSRGQLELPSKRIFKNKFLNDIDNFIKNALQLGDRPFYQAAYDGRIAELKRLGKTGEAAQTDAKIYAIERVLQNDSGLSRKASAIRKELGYLGDIVMPFTQTPANIMDKLIDYSPLGMGKIVHQLGTEVKSGKFNQKVFVDRLARCMTGTGIMALAFALASKGILTASLDNDDDMRSAQYQAGKQPYAIKLGKNYYSYDWAQPIGGLLAAGASFYEAGKNKDDILSSLTSGTGEAIDTVFNQTFLSGIMDMFSGYSPASGMFKSMLGATSQATPSGIASIAKITDSYMRETYDKNVFVQQGKKLAARVPGVSMILPKKLDGAGNPIVQSQGRNAFARTFDNMLSPGKFTTGQHDKVNDEAFRLFDKTDSKAAFLPVPPKKVTLDGKDYRLTADEYNKVAETKGKLQYDLISKMIASSTYKSLSDKEKVSVFSDTYGLAKAIAIKKVLPDYKIPKEQEKGYAAYKEGINPYQYLLYRQTADADKNGGVTKSEAQAALDMSDLSMEQKAYIWALDKISIDKNNPYK